MDIDRSSPAPRPRIPRLLGWAILLMCGLPMAAKLVADGYSDRAAMAHDGATALAFRPGSPDALWETASDRFRQGDIEGAQAAANAALIRDPTNAQGFQILALVAEKENNLDTATRLMGFASTLTWRSTPVQLWLFQRAVEAGNLDQVVLRGDAFLRRQAMQPFVRSAFQSLLLTQDGIAALAGTLGDNPPWRSDFLKALDPATPAAMEADLTLVDVLNKGSAPVTEDEVAPLLQRAVDTGYGVVAAMLWKRTSGADDNAVIGDPDGQGLALDSASKRFSPFRWQSRMSGDSQATAGLSPDGRPAIVIAAGDDPLPGFIHRVATLSPGIYALHYATSGDPQKRIGFAIQCAGIGISLPMDPVRYENRDWAYASTRFEIPSGCPTQKLSVQLGAGDAAADAPLYVRGISIDK